MEEILEMVVTYGHYREKVGYYSDGSEYQTSAWEKADEVYDKIREKLKELLK